MGNEVNSQESESQDEIDYLHNQCDEDAILTGAVETVSLNKICFGCSSFF